MAEAQREPTDSQDRLLRAREVCRLLRISSSTLHRLRRSGELPGCRLGTRIRRWPAQEISAYIRRRRDAE